MKRIGRIAPAMVLLATTLGCRTTALPDFAHPGRIENQQRLAQAYDPFPATDIAPSIDGGRPMAFDSPRDSVRQVQPPYSLLHRNGRPRNRSRTGYDW